QWAHYDFSLQQFLEHCATIADVHHQKICNGRHEGDVHFGELLLQIDSTFIDHPFRLAQMRIVLKRGESADLRDAVHVEWLPCSMKDFDHVRTRNRVTDSQPSQTINLRKRPQ